MKKLTKKSLLVLGLFATMISYANTNPEIRKEREPKVTSIILEKVKSGSVLTIKDVQGLVLYKESIDKSGDYSKGFDLTTLPNGKYFFELDSELKFRVIPFTVLSNEVVFDKEKEQSIYKPILRTKDDLVYVYRTLIDPTPISYKIYYADNYELVDSEKFEELEEVKKVYDFSNSLKGDYLFVFESEGRTYTKRVKI